jgi:hypothetical protein
MTRTERLRARWKLERLRADLGERPAPAPARARSRRPSAGGVEMAISRYPDGRPYRRKVRRP